jgi:phosphatidylethanolamine-binding protein (PEBP) family uncharacterized protein
MPSILPMLASVLQKQTSSLKIEFPNTTATTPGQTVAKELALSAPKLHLQSTDHDKTYLAVSLDPDAPFPSFPLLGPILHECQTGLAGTDGATDGGWTRLAAAEGPAASWIAPNPPSISGPHRYVFLVWEQPQGVTLEKIRQMMGWGEGNVGLGKRVRWDLDGFVRKAGLGEVVGGAWFVCG